MWSGNAPCCSTSGYCGSGTAWCGTDGRGGQPTFSFCIPTSPTDPPLPPSPPRPPLRPHLPCQGRRPPQPPTGPTVLSVMSTAIALTWYVPELPCGPQINLYRVMVRREDSGEIEAHHNLYDIDAGSYDYQGGDLPPGFDAYTIDGGTQFNYTLSSLNASTTYFISLRPGNGKGLGNESEATTVTTVGTPPTPPISPPPPLPMAGRGAWSGLGDFALFVALAFLGGVFAGVYQLVKRARNHQDLRGLLMEEAITVRMNRSMNRSQHADAEGALSGSHGSKMALSDAKSKLPPIAPPPIAPPPRSELEIAVHATAEKLGLISSANSKQRRRSVKFADESGTLAGLQGTGDEGDRFLIDPRSLVFGRPEDAARGVEAYLGVDVNVLRRNMAKGVCCR